MTTSAAPQPILFQIRSIPIWCFGERHGRQTRKFVLLMLATYANTDGSRCWPSVRTLGENCGLCERSIQKVIRWLRQHGFLTITLKAGPNQASVYTILIPEVTNSSVRDEPQRASRPEAQGVTNSSVRGVTNGSTQGDELQSSPNLPMDLSIPSIRPTKRRAPKNRAPFVLPDWVPVQEWNDFEDMRKKNRKMTDRARELIVLELAKLRDAGNPPAEVLNRSTRNGWLDVYPLNGNHSRKPPSQKISEIDHKAGLRLAPSQNVGRLR